MKTIGKVCLGAAAGLALAGCSQGFSAAERETIRSGGEGIMRVLTVDDRSDSLTLRRKSAPMVEGMERADDYETLRRRMLATVQDPENTGVGIAAPQVGILRRMIAVQRFDKPGEPFEIYLNPKIIEYSAETAPGREGCLSIPDRSGEVKRAQRITLRYRDEQFAERLERISGFTAVIFQHEIDHLDGILYTDRMERELRQEE
ncbi:peptide deformylase [Alistipes timonensis]|uniref:peptide deformylase n=1 Tax=Alistipes timonensis TaxID=1465754 RepID=UPI001C3C5BC9|nr:peptide deformylase [Alistipes timonensis]MCR2029833.1 peptide deformylase [Alistipes timonensis]